MIPSKIISGYRAKGFWWFRVFGYGIACKDRLKYSPLFSERIGKAWNTRIGNYKFHLLTP